MHQRELYKWIGITSTGNGYRDREREKRGRKQFFNCEKKTKFLAKFAIPHSTSFFSRRKTSPHIVCLC